MDGATTIKALAKGRPITADSWSKRMVIWEHPDKPSRYMYADYDSNGKISNVATVDKDDYIKTLSGCKIETKFRICRELNIKTLLAYG